MKKGINSVHLNMLMNVLLTLSSIIFPLITLPYVTRVLGAEGVGKVYFASSAISVFAVFAELGIPVYGIRACSRVRDDREELSRTVSEIMVINLIACCAVYVCLDAAMRLVPRFAQDRLLILIISSSMLLNCLGAEWLYKALEKYTYITARSVLFKLAALIAMFAVVRGPEDYIIYGFLTIFAASASNIMNFCRLGRYVDLRPISGTHASNMYVNAEDTADGRCILTDAESTVDGRCILADSECAFGDGCTLAETESTADGRCILADAEGTVDGGYHLADTENTAGNSLHSASMNEAGRSEYAGLRVTAIAAFKKHLPGMLILFALAAATTVYTNMDLAILGLIKGDAEAGLYGVAVRIKLVIVSLVTAVSAVLLPRNSFYYEKGRKDEFYGLTAATLRMVVAISVPAAIYFILYARESIWILAGEGFMGAVTPMMIIMPSVIAIGVSNVIGMQMLVPAGRERIVVIAAVCGAVVDLILNLILIPRMASSGAALATLAAEICVAGYMLYNIREDIPRLMKGFPGGSVLAGAAVFTAVGALIRGLNFNPMVRMGMSAVCSGGLYVLIIYIAERRRRA